jgi:Flp pilus assembly protein TadG
MNMRIPVSAGRRRRQAGNAILEIGLCLSVFFLIMFGVVEYSRVTYEWNFVSYISRAAVRYASLHGATSSSPVTAANVTSFVSAQAVALDSADLTVTTTWSPNNQPGSTVQVKVAYTHNPLLTVVMPNAATLSSTSQMVILQ